MGVQQAEELPGMGERGGPSSHHLHAEGREHQTSLQQILQGNHKGGGTHEKERKRVYVEWTTRLHTHLSQQSRYRNTRWCSHQDSPSLPTFVIQHHTEEDAFAKARNWWS